MEFASSGYLSWTFDAVHYPFLKVGWGSDLPSFLSFLGLLVVVFNLVLGGGDQCGLMVSFKPACHANGRDSGNDDKNDLVVVFAVGSWLYSLVRFQSGRSKFFIFTAALSLSLAAGSKTYAVPICMVLTLVTAWIWRKEMRTLLLFAGLYVPCIVLFGSIETYVLSWQIYHRPLGPIDFVHDQRNRDGLRD